jgi:S-(hydroxymethyl)glutathione dehydrogenase/alcohol dehydrogenase
VKTKAAVLTGLNQPWELTELDLDDPRDGEVLIRFTHAGLCHSDEHLRTGDLPCRMPIVGGHEGAGVIEAVGAGVNRVEVGDHVVCAFIPSCGKCRWCATGQQNICDWGATILDGCLPDGKFVLHSGGEDFGAMCMLGTFSQYSTINQASCVKVDKDIPLEVAVLCGCGVPTGWGSAVNAANTQVGDTIVVYGVGGIGANAVQGAALAGAVNVVAVDPLANKREMAQELGATHAVETAEEAHELVQELTRGVGADASIVTVDVVGEKVVQDAVAVIRKGGTAVLTGLADPHKVTVQVSGTDLTLNRKVIRGSLFGDCNPAYDILRMLNLYRAGKLKLDELITKTYSLDEVNQGYDDLNGGQIVRGVLVHQH